MDVADGDKTADRSEKASEAAFRKAPLQTSAAVAAPEPSDTEPGAEDPLWGDGPAVQRLEHLVGRNSDREIRNVEARVAGATS